ncbi:MAG: hypothetical protein KIT09_10575 [Bryobacteraceae bacterium]|nr:hypothetical protein [Bryobacteraceae bacterium]
MTPRERILAAVSRRAPDRLPVDLGSTLASTITIGAQRRLRGWLGMGEDAPVELFSRRSGTVIPDEAILERFGACARPVILGAPEIRPDRPLTDLSFVDEWGITWAKPGEGHYLNLEGPFSGLENPGTADLDRFAWPDPSDPGRFRGLRERARTLHEETPYAVVLGLGVGPVHQGQFLRGYAPWLEDLVANPSFAAGLLERVADVWIAIATEALRQAGDYVDIVMFGDDIATQRGPLMRPALYRKLIKPQHKRMVEAVRPFGKPVLYHTCGSVAAFIPDLIDVGIDVLNPIQVSAARMDTRWLKQEYGRDLAFWGAIDNQRVLPYGAPADVERETLRRIEDLGPGGGYVLAAAHNIQQDAPPENIAAMFDAAKNSQR